MKPNNTVADYVAGLQAARLEPVAEKSKLEAFATDCERRVLEPMGNDAAGRIRARLEIAETQKAIAEFSEWILESRQQFAADEYLKNNVAGICGAFRASIAERSKGQTGFIKSKLNQAAEITINLFARKDDRHKIYKEREAIEQAAEDAEAIVASAVSAVRMFEIMPNEQTFGAAAARVNEIHFPLVVTGS